jgi:hypothetical protein
MTTGTELELRRRLREKEELADPAEVERLRAEIGEEFRRAWTERVDDELRVFGRPRMILRRGLEVWMKAHLVRRMGSRKYLELPW